MITSVQNSRVKAVAKLQRQGRERRRRALFCVETARELERATAAGFEVAELYLLEHRPPATADTPRWTIVDRVRESAGLVDLVSEAVLRKISYRENPEPFVAVLRAKAATLEDLDPSPTGPVVVCSGLEKPGNVGAILRSAAGAGAAAVVLDRADFDLFNPNCIRASTGAVFSVPIACENRENVIARLRARGYRMIALSPEGERTYTDIDWRQPHAIVLGAEAEGLDAVWRDAADERVRIPLATNAVDSLNVSVAAAVVLFEAARQSSATANHTTPQNERQA